VARPIGAEVTPGVVRRLVAVDGTYRDVADTAVNAQHFGRPRVNNESDASEKP
jgi:hypothetical protein